jgi:alkanesulfonate monooxygenase SsuD/methylene tetrahydromethanopterin reductase-like flavin-dependent oxidoreductase (luciferase family)
MWYLTSNKVTPQFKNPPGYVPTSVSMQLLRGGSTAFDRSSPLDACIEQGIVFAGNPDTVYEQIKRHYEYCGGYGNLLMMGQAGFLEHDETVRSIELFAKEVQPRLHHLNLSGIAIPA